MIKDDVSPIGIVRELFHWILVIAAIMLLNLGCSAEQISNLSSLQGGHSEVIEASTIMAKMVSGEALNYDNITVIGSLNLSGQDGRIGLPVKITNSEFLGPINFEGIVFEEPFDLRGSIFHQDISFGDVRFLSDAKFAGATFMGRADFRDASFGGLASFMAASFLNDSSFGNVLFNDDSIFLESSFAKDVDFNFAQFARLTSFYDAKFENVSFLETQFVGHATFLNALFGGNATFAATRFNSDVVFRAAKFLKGSTFGLASFGGFADFANADFRQSAFFAVTKFADNAYFVNAIFDRDLTLEGARLYGMQLDNVSFGKNTKINLNGTDFIKLEVHWNIIKDLLLYNGAAYLALVKNYKSLEWYEDADDCYYQYRRISQAQEPWGWAKLADIISWLSCGYGVRVSYTVSICLITILFFGLIFWAGNGMRRFEHIGLEVPSYADDIQKQRVSLIDALYFSVAMFTTSQAPVNNYPVGFYRHLAMFEGILGWFFLGLFVVVLSGILIR